MDRRSTDRRPQLSQDIQIPTLQDILHILYKRRLLITVLLFVPVILGGIYLKTRPDIYKATASVIIENQELNLADFQDILAGMKFDNLTVPTQVQVISSPTLVQETIKNLNLQADNNDYITIGADSSIETDPERNISYGLMKAFLENLEVTQQGVSRVVDISFKSPDPEVAAKVANGHAKQYVFAQIRVKRQQAENLNNWISQQIVQLKEESLKKSRAAQQFRAESGMVLGQDSQELVYQQISDIAAQLTPIETKELDLMARKELLSGKNSSAIAEIVDSRLVQDLKSRSSQASQELESLRSDYGANHPQVIALKNEIKQIDNDIGREISNIKKSIENDLKAISKQKSLLEGKLEELKQEADTLQEKQITLQSLQVEEASSTKLYDNFMARSEEIKSQIDFTRPDVRIDSLADIPGEPIGSKKGILMLLLVMLSGIFAMGTALLLELTKSGIERKEDIKKLFDLKLLGCLPKEKQPIESVLEKGRSLYTEEIKRIYIHLTAQPQNKIIVFSSSNHDEGKSTIAVSLAYYLNSIGKKTLIIDADTLTPSLAGISMVSEKPGFYELLAGTEGLSDVIKRDRLGLSVIPCGEQNSFASDLLLAGRFEQPLAMLKEMYDFILIDTGPILNTSDAEILTRLADQVILVVLWEKTSRKNISQAAEILKNFSKSTPNVILNKMNPVDLKDK